MDGKVDVAVGDDTFDPWPFAAPRLTFRFGGRRLAGRFDDEDAMRAVALAAEPWVTLEVALGAP